MTPEQEALRAAYLAELWPVCREVPVDIRAGWAAVAAIGYPPNESTCGYAESTNTQPTDAR